MNTRTMPDLYVFALVTGDGKLVLLQNGSTLTLPYKEQVRSLELDVIAQMSRFFTGIKLSIEEKASVMDRDFSFGDERRFCRFQICGFSGTLKPEASASIHILGKDSIPSQLITEDMRPLVRSEALQARLR